MNKITTDLKVIREGPVVDNSRVLSKAIETIEDLRYPISQAKEIYQNTGDDWIKSVANINKASEIVNHVSFRGSYY